MTENNKNIRIFQSRNDCTIRSNYNYDKTNIETEYKRKKNLNLAQIKYYKLKHKVKDGKDENGEDKFRTYYEFAIDRFINFYTKADIYEKYGPVVLKDYENKEISVFLNKKEDGDIVNSITIIKNNRSKHLSEGNELTKPQFRDLCELIDKAGKNFVDSIKKFNNNKKRTVKV